MTMIDRESAEKLTAQLRDGTIQPARLAHSLLLMLDRALGRPENRAPGYLANEMEDKLIKFFDIVIQVAPEPPVPYTLGEIEQLAKFSCNQYQTKAQVAKIGDLCIDNQEELDDTVVFYQGISTDYLAIAVAAELGDLSGVRKLFKALDTADRENFGWGADIWDEHRWYVTLQGENK